MTIEASASGIASTEIFSDQSPSSPDESPSSGSPDGHDPENQSQVISRSEEYRQLFRLPADQVLVQDFNCASQESILLQGHLYLFIHYICFYSNIFGYETKKIIPFADISCVKRAKTAGIFPNAIEILAGGKKFFFASFLSRDEAFKLIHDGWLECGSAVKAEGQIQSSTNLVNDGVVKRALSTMDLLYSPSRYFQHFYMIYLVAVTNCFRAHYPSLHGDETPQLSGSSIVPVISQNDISPWKPEDLNAPKCS